MATFNIEMKHGQDHRVVEAERFTCDHERGWIIFYRAPATGGTVEYWRARLDSVVSMETKP